MQQTMQTRELRRGAAVVVDRTPCGRNRRLAGYSPRALYQRAIRPMVGGAIRDLVMPFLTLEDRLRLLGIMPIAGASRAKDIAFLAPISNLYGQTITSDTTQYYMVPEDHPFLFKGLLCGMLADADATTGDETIAISVDYTTDGTNWTAVASEAKMGGTLEAEAFLQYEPVTLPATTVASGLITAVHTDAAAINFRVPAGVAVRVVLNVTGTTPIFTNGVFQPFGIFI